jgi:hypothetical protein
MVHNIKAAGNAYANKFIACPAVLLVKIIKHVIQVPVGKHLVGLKHYILVSGCHIFNF